MKMFETFSQTWQKAIRNHEPRFQNFGISFFVSAGDPLSRLHVRLDHPGPVPRQPVRDGLARLPEERA